MALLDPILPYVQDVTEFADYPIVAQTVSRGRIISTVQASPKVWSFSLSIATPALRWTDYYNFLEDLRATNTLLPFSFTFAPSQKLSYLVPYRGVLTTMQQGAVTVAAATPNAPGVLNVANLPVSTNNVFRKGDFIQPTAGKPYTVLSDVNSSAGGTASLFLNRPLFVYPATGSGLIYGANVSWQVYFSKLPTPSTVAEYLTGLQWSGNFDFVETAM